MSTIENEAFGWSYHGGGGLPRTLAGASGVRVRRATGEVHEDTAETFDWDDASTDDRIVAWQWLSYGADAIATQAEPRAAPTVNGDVVPGMMRCAKCSFVLVRNVLHAQSGAITAGGNETEPCPNGCGPLWPMTWRQHAEDMAARCEEQMARAVAAEARCAALEADKRRLDFLDEANIRLNAKYGTTYRWRLVMNHNVNRLMLGDMDVDLQDSEPHALRSCRLAIDEKMREIGRATWSGPLLDDLRPMSDAKKNGQPILARLKTPIPGRSDQDGIAGLWVVVRHPGAPDDDDDFFDPGWNLAGPFGQGGLPDDWFDGWTPLPMSQATPPSNPTA